MTVASLGDLFKSDSTAGQLFLWGVLAGVLQALLQPEFEELRQLGYDILANTPLSPDEAAAAVNRHYLSAPDGASEAQKSGVNGDRFATMVDLAGTAPAAGDLAAALRRGLIDSHGFGPDSTSFDQGISEGNLHNKWADIMRQLAVQWPSPTDALDALLEGQISHDDALALFQKFGGAPQYFQMLYDTRGNAPTPVEAATMANRGIIPWDGTGPNATTFEQAFLEGPWRNKWEPAMRKLGQYLPPPRTVTAMIRSGGLSPAEGTTLLIEQGLTPALAAAYVHDAQQVATKTDRDLTQSQIVSLYEANIIGNKDAAAMLETLGYDKTNADYLLALADVRREIAALNYAVSRVQSLYVSHKLTRQQAVESLNTLNLPADQVHAVVQLWDVAAAANVKLLTETQVTSAYQAGFMTLDRAKSELEAMGYSELDAWVLLSLRMKAPVGPPPKGGTVPTAPGNPGV